MITYDAVTKRFSDNVAVDALSMRIARGEAVALLGPNGSGKTTTLKMAAGLIKPSGGSVTVGEPPLAPWAPDARRAISFLPQRVAFPEALTGREVVDFYRQLRGIAAERSQAVLRFASLNGAGERAVGTYSGGMVQRLGLAVAMLPESDVLLLDEPTAALDPDGLAAFYAVIEARQAEGRTILFTSHHVGDVERLADRFVVLVHGRVAAELTQAELRDRLAERGVMRVRLSAESDGLLERVRAIAPESALDNGELVVRGAASARPRVLDIVRASGVEVRGLTAEDGRLDALYRDLVAGTEEP
ncbi:MAG TPA: ABC transporter ATP-binding protein [Vicinamibacterales bacterium]